MGTKMGSIPIMSTPSIIQVSASGTFPYLIFPGMAEKIGADVTENGGIERHHHGE